MREIRYVGNDNLVRFHIRCREVLGIFHDILAALVAVVVIAVDQVPGGRGLQIEDDLEPPMVENGGRANLSNDANGGETPDLGIATEFRASPGFARLLGQPLRTAETRIEVNDRQVAVAEIPSTNSKVRIYQIRDN